MHKKLENLVALQGETVFAILIFNIEKCLVKSREAFPWARAPNYNDIIEHSKVFCEFPESRFSLIGSVTILNISVCVMIPLFVKHDTHVFLCPCRHNV